MGVATRLRVGDCIGLPQPQSRDVIVALMCYAAAAVADMMPMLMLIRHRSVQVCSLTNTGN